ncbi:MAG TPA: DUF58 domain-containing protein [Oligoflexia bacterium]|nr:DUF58 domain-containing protein [Oligoflexia bacterium]
MSQKFWLMFGLLQFVLLFGVYSNLIFYFGLGMMGFYFFYVWLAWVRFRKNTIEIVNLNYHEQLELNTKIAFELELKKYQLQAVRVEFSFEQHPALQWKKQKYYFDSNQIKQSIEGWAKKLGHFQSPVLTIFIQDNLNLFFREIAFNSKDDFEVLPNSQSENMHEILQILKADPYAMVWKNQHAMTRKSDLVVGAREYRPGDPLKLVDARKTGRLRKPMVKVFEQDETQHLEIILDVGRSMLGEIENSQKVDFYALLAYQLVRYTCGLGDTFSFASLNHQLHQYVYNSRKAEDFINVYRNQKIDVSPHDAQLEQAVQHIKKLNKPSVVFLLLDMLKPSMHAAIIKLLPQLDPKHKIIVLHVIEEKYNVQSLVAKQATNSQKIKDDDRRQLLYALNLQERKQDLMAKLSRSNVSLIDLPTQHAVGLVREVYKQLRL